MTKKLFIQTIAKFLYGFLSVAILLFVPAGTIDFFNAWLFISALFVPMFFAGLFMMLKKPELLKKRLNTKEVQNSQSILIKLSAIMFIFGFIVAGLDFRFGWSSLPQSVIVSAVLIFLFSYILYGIVIKQNPYLSRIIEIQDNQIVVDTGMYSVVRHPMYSVTVLMFLSMPLILGSIYAFFIFLLYPFLIAKRIKDEEIFLERELAGYTEYKNRVKYRLVPFIW